MHSEFVSFHVSFSIFFKCQQLSGLLCKRCITLTSHLFPILLRCFLFSYYFVKYMMSINLCIVSLQMLLMCMRCYNSLRSSLGTEIKLKRVSFKNENTSFIQNQFSLFLQFIKDLQKYGRAYKCHTEKKSTQQKDHHSHLFSALNNHSREQIQVHRTSVHKTYSVILQETRNKQQLFNNNDMEENARH